MSNNTTSAILGVLSRGQFWDATIFSVLGKPRDPLSLVVRLMAAATCEDPPLWFRYLAVVGFSPVGRGSSNWAAAACLCEPIDDTIVVVVFCVVQACPCG